MGDEPSSQLHPTMRRLTLLLALLLTPAAAHAQATRWIPLPFEDNPPFNWLDGKSMHVSGATLDVWIKQQAGLPTDTIGDGRHFETLIQHMLIHCQARESALIGVTYYDSAGSVLDAESKPASTARFDPYTPDSVGEFIGTSACAIARKRHLVK